MRKLTLALLSTCISASALAAQCDGVAPWQAGTAYVNGEQVVKADHLYQARWWTQADPVTTNGLYQPWEDKGACGGVVPTRVPTTTPTITPTVTPIITTTVTPTMQPTMQPTNVPSEYPTFVLGSTRAVNGQIYQYAGACYQAKNNPGTWETPKEGWFWTPVDCGDGASVTPVVSATVTATVTPTSTPTATPTVTTTITPSVTIVPTQPHIPNAKLPKRTLVGYWHNFENGSGYIPLADVSRDWDIINISFAIDKRNGLPGEVDLELCPKLECPNVESPAEFKAAVKQLQSEGKIVLLSLGGANVHLTLDTTEERDNFVRTMGAIIAEYGFDGMDIDLEGGSLNMTAGDTVQQAKTPAIVNLIDATKQLVARFGDGFILTMAPETAYVQGGYANFGGIWGAYLPLIHGLRNELDLLHVQHYNTGSLTGADGGIYYPGSVDFHVAMTDMMITGFDAGRDANNHFPGLRPDQLAFGLPSGNKSASSGFTSVQVAQDAVSCLVNGTNCGSYKPAQTYPEFRGLMTWSINWDRHDGYNFSRPHRQFLDSLQ